MPRSTFLIATAALLCGTALLSASALAQPTGTRMGKSADQRDMPQILQTVGACMAREEPDITRKWLNLLPGTKAEHQYVMTQEGALSICMERGDPSFVIAGILESDPDDLRHFAALEAGRRAAMAAPDALPASASEKPWFTDALAALKPGDAVNRTTLVQQDFGHCVVIANWLGARNFLRSKPKSKEEDAAIQALVPSLGPCVQVGAKVELTKESVRNALAEPFYHIANAATPTSTPLRPEERG